VGLNGDYSQFGITDTAEQTFVGNAVEQFSAGAVILFYQEYASNSIIKGNCPANPGDP
jgi:hypothetical protein